MDVDVEVEVVFLPGLSGDSGLGSVPLVQCSAAQRGRRNAITDTPMIDDCTFDRSSNFYRRVEECCKAR